MSVCRNRFCMIGDSLRLNNFVFLKSATVKWKLSVSVQGWGKTRWKRRKLFESFTVAFNNLLLLKGTSLLFYLFPSIFRVIYLADKFGREKIKCGISGDFYFYLLMTSICNETQTRKTNKQYIEWYISSAVGLSSLLVLCLQIINK
jgi:hypothetical protein